MDISPTLLLILGLSAFFLFLTVFTVSWIITFRNRRKIHKYLEEHQ